MGPFHAITRKTADPDVEMLETEDGTEFDELTWNGPPDEDSGPPYDDDPWNLDDS